ncbi:hypothetical protein BZG36_04558 [Bifiguratus adelaidae]|uniref:Protein Abitram n=1 Tax=Bifiguratus adelaidae TaxID=1938954 RepID=A0A261XX38_9FUNG|nr:hypothetical protein BZG36_04558 [Bifiguratus adelaidae]
MQVEYDPREYVDRRRDWTTNPVAYLDQYYTRYYWIAPASEDSKGVEGDLLIHQSPNCLCVLCLAPTHPLLLRYKEDPTIAKRIRIEFQDTYNSVNLSSKNKKGAPWLQVGSEYLKIMLDEEPGKEPEASDTEPLVYSFRSCIHSQMMEVNEKFVNDPDLLFRRPYSQGYLAIVKPKLDDPKKALELCITREEYEARQ